MSTAAGRPATASLSPLHWVGIALAVVTGIVHLVLGIGFLPHWMGVAFLLAAGGFFGAVVLVVLEYRRRLLYLVGIPYTAVQIVLWYALNQPAGIADISGAEAIDKLAQVALIVVLLVLYSRES